MSHKSKSMVALLGFVLPVVSASSAFAASVSWKDMVGVISAPGVNNPVGPNISSGTFPWSTQSGSAHVNLASGAASFKVRGLVINGQIFSGTPGPVNAVEGTLVCNPGDAQNEAIRDTPDVPIDGQGNAQFSGQIDGIPAMCANPVFLVRIATINAQDPNAARGAWIATGTQRTGKN